MVAFLLKQCNSDRLRLGWTSEMLLMCEQSICCYLGPIYLHENIRSIQSIIEKWAWSLWSIVWPHMGSKCYGMDPERSIEVFDGQGKQIKQMSSDRKGSRMNWISPHINVSLRLHPIILLPYWFPDKKTITPLRFYYSWAHHIWEN